MEYSLCHCASWTHSMLIWRLGQMFDSVHGHQFFITERKKNLGVISRKKIHQHHIETVGEISLTILVICGLLPSSFSLHRPRQHTSCRFERFEDSKTRCRTKHFGRKEGFNSGGRSYLPAFVRMFQSFSK